MLWKISSADDEAQKWQQRLIAEFPQSPEGFIAGTQNSVIVKPASFWFFINGYDSMLLDAVTRNQPSAISVPQVSAPVQQQPSTVISQTPQAPVSTVQMPAPIVQTNAARLQTGLYSRQVNAQTQIENLRKAGFSPILEQRGEMWAVIVPAEQDVNRFIRELRDAGFESFPVR